MKWMEKLFHPLLKMLPVFLALPMAAPTEASGGEKLLAEVTLVDFVGKVLIAVNKIQGRLGLDTVAPHTRVLQRINVDGQAKGMLREPGRPRDVAIVETRGVVGLHRGFVVSVEIVDQADAGNGITGDKQVAENVDQILGDGLVAHHLATLHLAVEIKVRQGEVTQIIVTNAGLVFHRFPLHPRLHLVGNGLAEKNMVFENTDIVDDGGVNLMPRLNRLRYRCGFFLILGCFHQVFRVVPARNGQNTQ